MLYNFVRMLFAIYLKVFFRLKVHGFERIPTRKPFIVCANHISWLDPLSIGDSLPASYRIHYMAKKELFNNPVVAYILKIVGAFPLNRKDADYAAIRRAYQLLQKGQVLGLFPEGSRSKSGKLQKAYKGSALIAVRSGVPILPIGISGPYRLFKPLHVFIGPPFVLSPLVYENKEEKYAQLEEMSSKIMERIGHLLPEQHNDSEQPGNYS